MPEASQGAQAWDRYAYVNNNPLIYNDPSGNCIDGISTVVCVVAGAMIAGAIIGGVANAYQQYQATGQINSEGVIDSAWKGALIGGALVIGGVAVASVATAITTAGEVACADGDCTNEVKNATLAIENIGQGTSSAESQIIPKLTQGKLDHIVLNHWSTSGVPNKSYFSADIGIKQLVEMIGKTAGDISLWTQQGKYYVRDININQIIGTYPSGQSTTWLRVVVNEVGEVVTTYPIPIPAPLTP